ncbi:MULTISPECIES: DUF3617 domain-containing protein [Sphingomonas]|uniref:DUF3617 domain-containing protein n=1 Tax=Sphingomonas TaxID=13687 RepID=UPI000DEEDC84|nr:MULTISPECIES: hypothetical protein [Sphingomonas]
MRRFLPSLFVLVAAPAAALAAVAGPTLKSLEPGLWSVSRSATGERAVSLCVHDFAALAQWEERGRQCHRTILSQSGSETVIRYNCPGGDFGEARLTAVTPRSLKLDIQGIHGGGPFQTALFARKSDACRIH